MTSILEIYGNGRQMNGELALNRTGVLLTENSFIKKLNTVPRRGYISGKKSDEWPKTVWNRNAGSAKISTLMIQKLMSKFSQNSVKVQEPRTVVLERIPSVGKSLIEDKIEEAWSKISAFLLLLKPDPNGGYSIICVNSTDSPEEIIIANVSEKRKGKGKQEKLICDSKTITKSKINNCEKIFISRDIDLSRHQRPNGSQGKKLSHPNFPVIGYFSGAKKPEAKVDLSNKQVINLVNAPLIESAKKTRGNHLEVLGALLETKTGA